jgi:glucokinase
MIGDLLSASRGLLREHPCNCVGVAIGGPMDARIGVVLGPPNLPGWDFVPLQSILENALKLPVRVHHDAAACALAEFRWGAGQECERLAYLTCATGFGVGLLIDGKPYYGANGRSMEIGHVRYREDGPSAFGKVGSFEAWGSARSLTRLAQWHVPSRWGTKPPTPEEVASVAEGGDVDAMAVIQMNAQAVGDACALVADLLVPNRILLGSLARYLGDPWMAMVTERFAEQSRGGPGEQTEVWPAGLGERLQDLSAVAAALP